jgi:glutaminase
MKIRTTFQDFLDDLYEELKHNNDGEVASYIPELAKANGNDFGIALVTVDGHVYQVGESRKPFSIQSISKAFCYGIALQDQGTKSVFSKVDVEPSGEAFNSISLEQDTGRPRNPMINAGAIAITSLINGTNAQEKVNRILEQFENYCGHALKIDEDIYLSEKETGHRNRAISHLLRNYDILESDPEETLDAYFQQCSILVTCRDLAVMGACLANSGVNPVTGVRALDTVCVPNVLSVMASCGMYDYSGNWIYSVGMPAKSGVGGGVVAVLPGQFGLAVYSPNLDPKGNSVRGISVCERFSHQFGLHMLYSARVTYSTVIRACHTGKQVRSKRERHPKESAWLDENGDEICVFELMGELTFVSAELVLRGIADAVKKTRYLIIDYSRVTSIDESASHLLVDLVQRYKTNDREILFVGMDRKYHFSRFIKQQLLSRDKAPIMDLNSYDQALEWCETELLTSRNIKVATSKPLEFHEQPLCQGMDSNEIEFFKNMSHQINFEAGDTICKEGDIAELVYLLESGMVSAWIQVDRQRKIRLGGSSAGWAFGESALLGSRQRSANIVADTDVRVRAFKGGDLLNNNDPLAIKVLNKIFYNLSILNDQRLRRANAQIRALSM